FAAANMVVTLGSHPTAGRPARKGEVENVTEGTAQGRESNTAPDYVRATQAAHNLGRQLGAFHPTDDEQRTPGPGTLPPHVGWIDMMLDDVDEYWRRVFTFSPFTVWFNITGQPALMLPLGRSASGFPIAVQLVGRYGEEGTILGLGAQLEK